MGSGEDAFSGGVGGHFSRRLLFQILTTEIKNGLIVGEKQLLHS